MTCKNCGHVLSADAKFCNKCGAKKQADTLKAPEPIAIQPDEKTQALKSAQIPTPYAPLPAKAVKTKRRLISGIIVIAVIAVGVGFYFVFNGGFAGNNNAPASKTADESTWAFYWYICGSDLETDSGFFTEDIREMSQVYLPDNIEVVIMAGGALQWKNDYVDPQMLNIFHYTNDNFEAISKWPLASMGDASTLHGFLDYCVNEFPADNQVVLFSNHGGGSVGGLCTDEIFNNEALSLMDLHKVFGDLDTNFEMIGLDVCLMATIETAGLLYPYANWMVASQELEPGTGWDYKALFSELAKNPDMHGGELGKIICDSYAVHCVGTGYEDKLTLSVTDLAKMPEVLAAYDNIGMELLRQAEESIGVLSAFGRAANSAKNYANDRLTEDYTNMIDIGDLIRKADILFDDEGMELLQALDDAIYYSVNGKYQAQATGLSSYYCYDGNYNIYNIYASLGSKSAAFDQYFYYMLTGEALADDTFDYSDEYELSVFDLSNYDFEDFPVNFDGDYAYLNLGSELVDLLVAVSMNLAFVSDDDTVVFLGSDADLYSYWDEGIFYDNFQGSWPAIDGAVLYMEVNEITEEDILYTSPILLNSEEYYLHMAYNIAEEKFHIIGAQRAADEYGFPDRNMVSLKPGDVVAPILTVMDYYNDNFEDYTLDEITITLNTTVEWEDLGDNTFCFMFQMWDFQGNEYFSEMAEVTIEDGEYYWDGAAIDSGEHFEEDPMLGTQVLWDYHRPFDGGSDIYIAALHKHRNNELSFDDLATVLYDVIRTYGFVDVYREVGQFSKYLINPLSRFQIISQRNNNDTDGMIFLVDLQINSNFFYNVLPIYRGEFHYIEIVPENETIEIYLKNQDCYEIYWSDIGVY